MSDQAEDARSLGMEFRLFLAILSIDQTLSSASIFWLIVSLLTLRGMERII